MAGEKTIKRLREYADTATDMEAVAFGEAADKIERLVVALGNAKVALLNKHDPRLLASAEQDTDETLKTLDADL